jgi:hypothetical protein
LERHGAVPDPPRRLLRPRRFVVRRHHCRRRLQISLCVLALLVPRLESQRREKKHTKGVGSRARPTSPFSHPKDRYSLVEFFCLRQSKKHPHYGIIFTYYVQSIVLISTNLPFNVKETMPVSTTFSVITAFPFWAFRQLH